MKVQRLIGLMALALVVGGCAQAGPTVIQHDVGAAARTTDVVKAGAYALYDTYDTTPQVTVQLLVGDKLGFSERDGEMVAVAGSRTFPVISDGRSYFWKMK